MKTYIYKLTIGSLVCLMLTMSGCGSFLEEDAKDFLSPENLPNTENECKMLLMGSLSYWRSNAFERPMNFIAEATTDAAVSATPDNIMRNDMKNLTWQDDNESIWKAWYQFYQCINSVNIMIKKIPNASSMTVEQKNLYIAAAKYMRGMSYFYLVRMYDKVVYLDEPIYDFTSANNLMPTPAADVYNKIIEDLLFAEQYLPGVKDTDKWDLGTERPTKVAAKSLLAWVYITMAGDRIKDNTMWAKAAAKAKEVIDNKAEYGTGLEPEFSDLWKVDKRYNKESIFALNFATDLGDNQATVEWRPTGVGSEAGWAFFYTLPSFMDKFDDADKRKEATFLTKIVSEKDKKTYLMSDFGHNFPHSAKWFDAGRVDFSQRNRRTDAYIPIIRYAYVLLMYAEAENEANGPGNAYGAVNELRSRAGMPDLAGLSKDQFREAIQKEWTLETTHERLYRFNLVRWGTYLSTMRKYFEAHFPDNVKNVTEDKLYFPVPLHDKLINPNLR